MLCQRIARLLALVVVVASGALAAESGAPAVTVHYRAPALTVQINESVAVRTVLEKVCLETRARCDGLELITGDVAAPLALSGTWSEVVTKLLEGTSLNYFSMPGRLLIQQRSAAGPQADAPHREFTRDEKESNELRSETPSAPPRFVSEPRRGEEKDSDEADGSAGSPASDIRSGGGGSAETSTGDGKSGPPGFMGGPVNPVPYAGPRYSPFPDSNGNPVLLNPNAPSNVSPFPDSRGMPVLLKPLPPGQKMGSPFPPATPPKTE
jgi:hypothetical protein